jgi:hypothetical protein
MTGRDDLVRTGFEARLAAVEPFIPDAPRWAGPAESPADGTLSVVRGATVTRVGSTERQGRMSSPFRLAAGMVAVAVAAIGLAWIASSRETGPGAVAELPDWTHVRWVPVDGAGLTLDIAADRFILSDDQAASIRVDLTTAPRDVDRLRVFQAQAAVGCTAGASGEYEWHLEGTRITFVVTAEQCVNRGTMLGRTWVRELPRRTLGAIEARPGEYRLGWLRPAAGLTLPADVSISRVLEGPRLPPVVDDYWDATVGSGVVVITRLDRLPVDACKAAAGDREMGGASLADALAGMRSVAGLEVGEERPTTLNGRDAFEVDVGIAADCADGQGRLWSAMPTPFNGEGGDGLLPRGGVARVRLVQVDGAVVAIAVSPNFYGPSPPALDDVANELRPLLDSITFD